MGLYSRKYRLTGQRKGRAYERQRRDDIEHSSLNDSCKIVENVELYYGDIHVIISERVSSGHVSKEYFCNVSKTTGVT